MAVADLLNSFAKHAPVADLDLSLLDSALSLPCIIDESRPLLEYPIYSTAVYRGNGIYEHYLASNETLLEFLTRIYQSDGPFPMDCGAYAQLTSLYLGFKPSPNPGDKSIGSLFSGTVKLYVASNALGTILLWTQKLKQMVYLRVVNSDINSYLQTLPTMAKGQWLIQIDEDSYLGLLDDGPAILNLEAWINILYQALDQYNRVARNPTLAEYLSTGQLKLWGIYIDGLKPVEIFELQI